MEKIFTIYTSKKSDTEGYIDFLYQNGARAFYLGSREAGFIFLSEEEIKKTYTYVVEKVKEYPDTILIVEEPIYCSLDDTINYIKFLSETKADFISVGSKNAFENSKFLDMIKVYSKKPLIFNAGYSNIENLDIEYVISHKNTSYKTIAYTCEEATKESCGMWLTGVGNIYPSFDTKLYSSNFNWLPWYRHINVVCFLLANFLDYTPAISAFYGLTEEEKEKCLNTIANMITKPDFEMFVVHYKKLTDRKIFMLEQLDREKMNPVWIDEPDRDSLTDKMLAEWYNHELDNKTCGVRSPRQMTRGEIAATIAHCNIIENIHNIALIIEDDVILKKNFMENVNFVLKNAPSDWEILSLGGPYYGNEDYVNNDVDKQPTFDNIKIFAPKARCFMTCCYLIRKEACKRIMRHPMYKPFILAVDSNFSYISLFENIKIYWVSPWLGHEGSKSDKFSTSFPDRGY